MPDISSKLCADCKAGVKMNLFDKIVSLETEAADFGFKWETFQQIKAQIISELAEVEVHLNDQDPTLLQEEVGDLLHAAFSLTVFLKLNPEATLQNSVNKFERRYEQVKKIAAARGLSNLNNQSFDELMEIWNQAKQT